MHPSDPAGAPGLALGLLRAAGWFDEALLDALQVRGWPRLTRTQSQLFAALGPQGASVAELARRVGVTRQSMHRSVAELVAEGVLQTRVDEHDARAVVVALTSRGRRLVQEARVELELLERVLAGRIGQEAVQALRRALDQPWGDPPPPGGDRC